MYRTADTHSTYKADWTHYQQCVWLFCAVLAVVETPATTGLSAIISATCPKCGIIKKSGKHSCCARGGAWFKNCGEVGDTKFDHTWTEGIQACKGFGNSIVLTPPPHFIVRHGRGLIYPLNTTPIRNITKQHTAVDRVGAVSDEVNAGCEQSFEITKFAICLIGLVVSSHWWPKKGASLNAQAWYA